MEIDYKEILSYAIILIIVLIAAQHLNVVVSGSMEPAFYRGDIVVVEKANFFGIHEFDPNSVEVGDVVVTTSGFYGVLIDVTEEDVIVEDNNDRPDPYYVKPSQIQEKVVTLGDNLAVIPKIGYLSLWLRGL